MASPELVKSPVVAQEHRWRIRPAYSRDYYPGDVRELGLVSSEKLPNPTVVLRELRIPYIVPLRCDFCGTIGAESQVNVLLWCGREECRPYDAYLWWLRTPVATPADLLELDHK